MAFIKIGDEKPIIDFYDDNIKERFCPTCGKKLIIIAIEKDENKLICESCELEANITKNS
jgi:hypothetical protein